MQDPQIEALSSLVALFEGELARVTFPDVSAGSLRSAAEAMEERRQAVLAAEAAVRAARESLDEARQAYERLGRRALAYARIYAEGDVAIANQLVTIGQALDTSRTEAPSPEPARRRGRPRKNEVGLFEVEPSRAASTDSDESELAQSA